MGTRTTAIVSWCRLTPQTRTAQPTVCVCRASSSWCRRRRRASMFSCWTCAGSGESWTLWVIPFSLITCNWDWPNVPPVGLMLYTFVFVCDSMAGPLRIYFPFIIELFVIYRLGLHVKRFIDLLIFQEHSWWEHSKHCLEGYGQHCLWIRYVSLKHLLSFKTTFPHSLFYKNIKCYVLCLAVQVPRRRGLRAELQWLHQRCVCQVFEETTARRWEDHRGARQSRRGWETNINMIYENITYTVALQEVLR